MTLTTDRRGKILVHELVDTINHAFTAKDLATDILMDNMIDTFWDDQAEDAVRNVMNEAVENGFRLAVEIGKDFDLHVAFDRSVGRYIVY